MASSVKGWAEPLLDRIARNWSNVVWPVIDVISWKTLEFKNDGEASYGRQVGGFDWGLQFNWHPIPKRDDTARPHSTAPVRSPTMAGGLFSIDRKYFEHLGTYDEEFDIWGGENLELSFKVPRTRIFPPNSNHVLYYPVMSSPFRSPPPPVTTDWAVRIQ